MKKKIIGINIARAIAIVGMIIVNFKIILGDQDLPWLQAVADVLSGKASATFVVLAGVGLGLMSQSAAEDKAKQHKVEMRILKRSLFLLVLGFSYYFIWPADILHYYGVYMLFALPFLFRHTNFAVLTAFALIFLFPILLFNFNYELGWNWETLEYVDFWTANGFFRNLFFNGFHPFVPWAAFLLIGIWLGKQDLRDPKFLMALLQRGLALFITAQVLSPFAAKQAISILGFTPESAEMVFGTGSMPPNPLYMFNGVGIAFTVISASILWGRKRPDSWWVGALDRTGQMALSFYVLHVVLGMSIPFLLFDYAEGAFPIYITLPYALLFSLICILFANFYLKRFRQGPLEWIMRKIT